MDEKELKTSGKQRFFIILIAILMLGSIIASYTAIIISGSKNNSDSDSNIDQAKVAELSEAYEKALSELPEATKDEFNKLVKYKSEVKAFNQSAANERVNVETKDLEVGKGKTLTENDVDYVAFYIGWCPNEKVFESSFDNYEKPTKFEGFFDVKMNSPIEGWRLGMDGAKLGGVREITIPSSLAYKEQELEECGGGNMPIKFIIIPMAREGKVKEIAEAAQRLQYAQYGIDYDSVKQNQE